MTVVSSARAKLGPTVVERWYSEKRLGGLSRFACAITLLNVIGHPFLGFECPWLAPFAALAAAYGTDLVGDTLENLTPARLSRDAGCPLNLINFLVPDIIT